MLSETEQSALINAHRQLEATVLAKVRVDPGPLRRRWHQARRLACDPQVRHPHPAEVPARLASHLGTGLSRRLELLFGLNPRPQEIPNPTPWDPEDLYGFGWTRSPFRRVVLGPDVTWQQVAAAELAARAQAPIEPRWTMVRGLSDSERVAAFAHLDELTATAAEVLLPAFADRVTLSTQLEAVKNSRGVPVAPGIPDLVFPGCLVEVKASSRPELLRDWLTQLATYVLMDLDDVWGLDEVAIYQARWGLLFRMDLGELVAGAGSPRGLRAARARYRQVRDSHLTLLEALHHRHDDEEDEEDETVVESAPGHPRQPHPTSLRPAAARRYRG